MLCDNSNRYECYKSFIGQITIDAAKMEMIVNEILSNCFFGSNKSKDMYLRAMRFGSGFNVVDKFTSIMLISNSLKTKEHRMDVDSIIQAARRFCHNKNRIISSRISTHADSNYLVIEAVSDDNRNEYTIVTSDYIARWSDSAWSIIKNLENARDNIFKPSNLRD